MAQINIKKEDLVVQNKLITLPLWAKKALSKEAIEQNFDGLKCYIEYILEEKAKELIVNS